MADSLELENFFSALNTKRVDIRKCITKVMNTLSFRKLAGKTQVILSLTGPDVRTRLTHTIEVANIAKDICIALGLNEDLAEAMALAHDIGHTPFGHVGERTLRKIICGCDTLGEKVQDCDFDNSGFKHNLQSFRVLIDLERINNDSNGESEYDEIWPYIIWGVLAHTDMTYAKSYSGMDDEIFISSKHCDWVYVCYYDKKKECKRNIQKKKRKEKTDFRVEEFKGEYTLKSLCEKLNQDGISTENTLVDSLNALLKQNDLYAKIKALHNEQAPSESLVKLEEYYTKVKSKDELKKLNRAALEEFYPHVTPKYLKEKEICKPWYCAMLPCIEDREEVDENDLNINETTIEYIKKKPIKNKYLKWIFCSRKCYLAKLWEHKIYQKPIYLEYPYLFDHPFPNSFYAKSLNS